ncbi:MAG: helix-turn-helix domain-containing protein [Oscillospiraceae bacterium]
MNKDNMFNLSLSEYLMELLKEKKLKRSDVIRNSGLDEAYVYEIFSGRKKPSRDKLIAVTFGLQLNVQETQRVLKVGGHTELYPRMERDAAILFAVRKQKNIFETDEMLLDNGFPTLLNDAE